MPTECSRDVFGFAPVEGRQVIAGFDGGDATSDAGCEPATPLDGAAVAEPSLTAWVAAPPPQAARIAAAMRQHARIERLAMSPPPLRLPP